VIVTVIFGAIFVPAQKPIRDVKPTIILISLDGFRYDYVDKFSPPAISKLAKEGVRAKWMIPSFPTKTFPNHYTIVTGLYPEHHGIVGNNVWDYDTEFTLSKVVEVEKSRWWWGEPIWVTAEKQGQHAASYFWPGSNTEIEGILPTFTRRYNANVPNAMRVDGLLAELDKNVETRPTMLTMYFNDTDNSGHEFGPDSEAVKYAAWNVDSAIERLMAGLKKRKIDKKVNVIVVSDHGMASVDQHNAILMDNYFDLKDKSLTDSIVTSGELWQIFAKDGKVDQIMDGLKNIQHARCWRKADVPERLHYSTGRRVAPIVCSSDEGWFMTDSKRYAAQKISPDFDLTRGAHGNDNEIRSMMATFIAHGPAFKRGYIAEPFPNIDVYELMCKILGLKPAKNDGNLKDVKKMLR